MDELEQKYQQRLRDIDQKMRLQELLQVNPITLQMIHKYCFARGQPVEGGKIDDDSANKIIYLKTIRLGFVNIGEISNLDLFDHLQSLFLESNKIKAIKGLEKNINLEFLALQNNYIKKIENISHLSKLALLDLSNN